MVSSQRFKAHVGTAALGCPVERSSTVAPYFFVKLSTTAGACSKYQITAARNMIPTPLGQIIPGMSGADETAGTAAAMPATHTSIAVQRAQLRTRNNPHPSKLHAAPTRSIMKGPASSSPYMSGAALLMEIAPGATRVIAATTMRYAAATKQNTAITVTPTGRLINLHCRTIPASPS